MRRVVALSIILLGALAAPALAQTSDRGWVDVSYVSATPLEKGQTYTFTSVRFQEPFLQSATYPELPRAQGVLVSGGVRVAGPWGIGFMFTPLKYNYEVDLSVTVAHPSVFNRSTTAKATNLDEIQRKDNALDISVSYQPPLPDTWRVRLFAGPTYFAVKQDFVKDIIYLQSAPTPTVNNVTITNYVPETVDKSAWGFHAGADVAYFFSRYLGAGATVRFNRGTAKIDSEPLSEQQADLKVGSLVVGAGLRLRF